jgi:hypothetical protein
VSAADLPDLKEAAERASEAAKALGAGGAETYRPALDPGAMGQRLLGRVVLSPFQTRVSQLSSRWKGSRDPSIGAREPRTRTVRLLIHGETGGIVMEELF